MAKRTISDVVDSLFREGIDESELLDTLDGLSDHQVILAATIAYERSVGAQNARKQAESVEVRYLKLTKLLQEYAKRRGV